MSQRRYSEAGRKFGREFLEELQQGTICEVVRTNSAKDYTGAHEKMDLEQYTGFLKSYTYKDLFDSSEVGYDQY